MKTARTEVPLCKVLYNCCRVLDAIQHGPLTPPGTSNPHREMDEGRSLAGQVGRGRKRGVGWVDEGERGPLEARKRMILMTVTPLISYLIPFPWYAFLDALGLALAI